MLVVLFSLSAAIFQNAAGSLEQESIQTSQVLSKFSVRINPPMYNENPNRLAVDSNTDIIIPTDNETLPQANDGYNSSNSRMDQLVIKNNTEPSFSVKNRTNEMVKELYGLFDYMMMYNALDTDEVFHGDAGGNVPPQESNKKTEPEINKIDPGEIHKKVVEAFSDGE
jgi:hypothetical protein